MRFIVFLVRFVEKGPKTANSGQYRGSFAATKRPLAAAKVLATAKGPMPQRGQEGGFFHPRVRRGEATVHSMEMLCFCFVLFFRCSEDLSIGLIRIL